MSATPTTPVTTTILTTIPRNPTLPPIILHLSLDQNCHCITVDTTSGFAIFNLDPFCEVIRRDFSSLPTTQITVGGGIGLIQTIPNSHIMAIVGCGVTPLFTLNKVIIWDNFENQCLAELNCRSYVKSIRLGNDYIVVVLMENVHVYNLEDITLLHRVDTMSNPMGLCEVSDEVKILACLGLQKGDVQIVHYMSKRTKIIRAHGSNIASIALAKDGRLLATASRKGTLIRVFNTWDGTLLHELRRGSETAEIYSLSFSLDAKWLAASSSRATVHVFRLDVDSRRSAEPNIFSWNSISLLSLITGVSKYFSSQWSIAQFRVPRDHRRNIVTFGDQENTLIIIGMGGSYYKCQFDPVKGGEMKLLLHLNLLQPQQIIF